MTVHFIVRKIEYEFYLVHTIQTAILMNYIYFFGCNKIIVVNTAYAESTNAMVQK